MKRVKEYEELFATNNIKNIEDFINELNEDENVNDVKVEKTGEGFKVTWTE